MTEKYSGEYKNRWKNPIFLKFLSLDLDFLVSDKQDTHNSLYWNIPKSDYGIGLCNLEIENCWQR